MRSKLGVAVLFRAFAVFVAVLGTPLILFVLFVLAVGRKLRTWWSEGLGRRITESEVVEKGGVAAFESGNLIEEGIDEDKSEIYICFFICKRLDQSKLAFLPTTFSENELDKAVIGWQELALLFCI